MLCSSLGEDPFTNSFCLLVAFLKLHLVITRSREAQVKYSVIGDNHTRMIFSPPSTARWQPCLPSIVQRIHLASICFGNVLVCLERVCRVLGPHFNPIGGSGQIEARDRVSSMALSSAPVQHWPLLEWHQHS